jgi:hypothetical protein
MTGFSISFLGSLVAGVVLLLLTATVSSQARWILTGILGRLLGVEIDVVFSGKRSAEADMRDELGRAKEVALFTGRGNELQRDTFAQLFVNRPAAKQLRVRILLPTTDSCAGLDWTEQRQEELASFDDAFRKPGLLKEQIEATARFLHQYVTSEKAELRRFNYPHTGRLLLTERCAYFTPYRHDSHARDCPVYKFRRGYLYDNLARLFEQLWTADVVSATPTPPRG